MEDKTYGALNPNDLLNEKIKIQRNIQLLEPRVTEFDRIQGTTIARRLRRLKTELNFTEDGLTEAKRRA